MGNNYAPLVTDSYIFCYEREFMLSHSDNYQADVVKNLTLSQDVLFKLNNPYFEQMVSHKSQ